MSILEPQEGEVFSIRTFKNYQGYRWANTYELLCLDGSATYSDLTNAAVAICNRERVPLSNVIRIYKATISTYQPDSKPYNPSTFTTINLNMPGQAGFSNELLPLNVCVFARRNVLLGRSGKSFYRGYLTEGDVSWGGDRFEISGHRQNQIASELQAMLRDVQPRFQFVLARGTPLPTNLRNVIGVTIVSRTTFKKLDNRYFDVADR